MFKKNVSGKGKAGILLCVVSLFLAGYGYYLLREVGQQAAQGVLFLLFPYQAIALFVVALMMAMFGSTLILLGKGGQVMATLTTEEPEDERFPTGKAEESNEEVVSDKKAGLVERIKSRPLWLVVALSIVLAISLTSVAMLAIFGF